MAIGFCFLVFVWERFFVLVKFLFSAMVVSVCCVGGVSAEIVADGDIQPISQDGENWNLDEELYVGYSSSGYLGVFGGSLIDIDGGGVSLGESVSGFGTVEVSGDGTSWESSRGYIGRRGSGEFKILDGASVYMSGFADVGREVGAYGNVEVRGEGSAWTTLTYVRLGVYTESVGVATVSEGGHVASSGLTIGSSGSGEVVVDGMDSRWDNNAYLSVGHGGAEKGDLKILNGGYVSSVSTFGSSTIVGKKGTVLVSGEGSIWSDSGEYVKVESDGVVDVLDGGRFYGEGLVRIGSGVGFHAEVNVSGADSVWQNPTVGLGYYDGSYGELNVSNDGEAWFNHLSFGGYRSGGSGGVNVYDGGLLVVDHIRFGVGDDLSEINISSGGALAFLGYFEDLAGFLDQIDGDGLIRFLRDDSLDWVDSSDALLGVDYTLEYIESGKLQGYTVIRVGSYVPEPSILLIGLVGGLTFLMRFGF